MKISPRIKFQNLFSLNNYCLPKQKSPQNISYFFQLGPRQQPQDDFNYIFIFIPRNHLLEK